MDFQEQHRVGHALYQLFSDYKLLPGNYFAVNGPYDTHGRVVKLLRESDAPKLGERKYLYLVRGTGRG